MTDSDAKLDFTLEHLVTCEGKDVQAFLRESTTTSLSRILYVASDALRDRLLTNLSGTAQLVILDEMLCTPPKSAEEVQEAVEDALRTLAKLEAEGTLQVTRDAAGLSAPRTFKPGAMHTEDVPRQILEYDWAARLLDLRKPMRGLSLRELRSVITEVSNRDLTILVCTPPFDRELLKFIGRGLAERAYEMIREDCEKWTDADLLHYFIAYSTLEKAVGRAQRGRADAQDIARFKTLGLQLLAYGDEEFRHVVREHLSNQLLEVLMLVLGGLNGPWAKRLRRVLSEAAWPFIEEDYHILAGEPLQMMDVIPFVLDLPEQLVKLGHPLPAPIREPLTLKYPLLGTLLRWLPDGRSA